MPKSNIVFANGSMQQEALFSTATPVVLRSVLDVNPVGNTITPAELLCNVYTRDAVIASAFIDTLPTGAAMDAAMPDVAIGDSWVVQFMNHTDYLWTINPGVGFATPAPLQIIAGGTWVRITKLGVASWSADAMVAPKLPLPAVVTDTATAGGVFTGAELMAYEYDRSGPTVAFTDTLPTGALMDAAMHPKQLVGGGIRYSMKLNNLSAVAMTIAPGVGFTILAGSVTVVPANSAVTLRISRTAAATWAVLII
jgi:hypothetical protein